MIAALFYWTPLAIVTILYTMKTVGDVKRDLKMDRQNQHAPLTIGTLLIRAALALTPVVNIITAAAMLLPYYFRGFDKFVDTPVVRKRR